MSDEENAPGDAARSFAELMSGAAQAADSGAEEAPYGYTRDRQTGEIRPKKSPGRGGARNAPSLEELKAAKTGQGAADTGPAEPEPAAAADRAPVAPDRRTRKRKDKAAKKAAEPVPQYRQGVIAKGMNKFYARAGKIVRVWDPHLGEAILATTRKESDDDVTVGEAWDELARGNPRIRGFLLRLVAGGAWGQLAAAHAPIFLAIAMKDGVRRFIPFSGLLEAMLSDDEDGTASDLSQAIGGMTPEDVQQMMGFAQGMMAQMAGGMSHGEPMPRVPTLADDPQ